MTEQFGIDDYHAGLVYGLWGSLLTAFGFLLGGTIDVLVSYSRLPECSNGFMLSVCLFVLQHGYSIAKGSMHT